MLLNQDSFFLPGLIWTGGEGTSAGMKIARKLAGGVRLRTLLNQRLNDGRSLEIALLLDKNSCIIVAQTIQGDEATQEFESNNQT